jgi:hypothetical protein
VRLAQRRLGADEVAAEAPDVGDRVEAVGLWRRGVVGRELGRGPLQLHLGALPRPANRRDFGTVDPADAREALEGLALAVLLGRLDPLARSAVVGHVAARTDHPARGDAAREGRQLPVDGGDRRLLHQCEPIARCPGRDLQRPEVRLRVRLEIGVGCHTSNGHSALGQAEGRVEITG